MYNWKHAAVFLTVLAVTAGAQTLTVEAVPRVIRIGNTFHPQNGQPASPIENVTVAIYAAERDTDALWSETQNVPIDGDGRYTMLMGATYAAGIPLDVLASGESRWLGIRFNRPGEPEQPRTLIASVPYALRAADADSLGGRPASAYQLASNGTTPGEPGPRTADSRSSKGSLRTTSPKAAIGTGGYLAQFLNTTDLGNSVVYQNANGYLGLGTAAPAFGVDILPAGIGAAAAVRIGNPSVDNRLRLESAQPYMLGMKSGLSGIYSWMGVTSGGHYQFSDQNGNALLTIQQGGNVGIGTTTPQSSLDVVNDINAGGMLKLHGVPALQTGLLTGNTAVGYLALPQNTSGTNNTVVGYNSLAFNSAGKQNVGTGGYTLYSNSTGSYNVASGYGALQSSVGGNYSTAVGYQALAASNGPGSNTAVGANALGATTAGIENTAVGTYALGLNTGGTHNAALGHYALYGNGGGAGNTAIGDSALYNANGSGNIGVGNQAGYQVSAGHNNNIEIGNLGTSTDEGTIRIGTAGTHTSFYTAGVRGVTTGISDAVPVVIDSRGQLGTVSSSRRFKEEITDMDDSSSGLMMLRPVTFRYKQPFADGSKPLQYGLIAEEVAEVYPELVARGADGQIETVKYQVLDSMLLNELQRQQRTIERLQADVEGLKARLIALEPQSGYR